MCRIYKLKASLLLFRSEGFVSVQVTMWECPLHGILIVVACPRLSTFIGLILRDDGLLKCDRRSPYYRPHRWTMNISISAPCLSRQLGDIWIIVCLFVATVCFLSLTLPQRLNIPHLQVRYCHIYFQTDFCVFSTLFIPFEFTWHCLFEPTASIAVNNTWLLLTTV
jgi:hypothetical protein